MISDMTDHSPEEINRALSNPAAEKVLKRRITDGSIELVNSDTQAPVFTRQLTKIATQGYRAANGSPMPTETDGASQLDPEEAELVSKALFCRFINRFAVF